MEVWRIEDVEGFGMYYNLWWKTADTQNDQWHPTPYESHGLLNQARNKEHIRGGLVEPYHFGFSGKRQFLQWVYDPEWRKNMHLFGAKLKVYKVDKRYCCIDDHQVMFVKEKATLVREMDIDIFDR